MEIDLLRDCDHKKQNKIICCVGVKKRDIETRGSCGRIPKRTDQSGTTDEESSSVVGGSLSKSIERLFKYIVIIIINPRVDGDRRRDKKNKSRAREYVN